jgi:uncharacterized protein YbaR (Trm112 family)
MEEYTITQTEVETIIRPNEKGWAKRWHKLIDEKKFGIKEEIPSLNDDELRQSD